MIIKPKCLNDFFFVATTRSTSCEQEPRTVGKALKHKHWREAMSSEFNALLQNQTWDLVPPINVKNIVEYKWIFHIKRNPNGSICRYKAHFVAKGFHQYPSIDYLDTFTLVIKLATIWVILSTTLSQNWPLRLLDINNAFLQGRLQEVVYVSQPPSVIDPNKKHYVCKLRKAIYGLNKHRECGTMNWKFLCFSLVSLCLIMTHLFSFIIIVDILIYVNDIVFTWKSHWHTCKGCLGLIFSIFIEGFKGIKLLARYRGGIQPKWSFSFSTEVC